MKKLLKILALAFLVPTLAFAAFNDVTLTTDVTLTSNGVSLSVNGSSAVLESITVGSGSFTVIMPSGSSIEVRSADRKVIEVAPTSHITTNICSSSESRIKLENSGSTATITVTPSSITCQGFANTGSGGGGGGPAPACEDSIDNDRDGLTDMKDPGCQNAADTDETNSTPTTSTTAATTVTATTTASIATSTPMAVIPETQTQTAAAASPDVSALVGQLRALIARLKTLGGTPSASLEATLNTLGGITSPRPAAFTRDLKFGVVGDDVRALQIFLNMQGFLVATSGPGSKGNETTRFGPATRAALIKFQKAKGIVPAAGYFGPKTRAVVNGI